MIESFPDLLAHWTVPELRADLRIDSYQTAAAMRRRGSVSPLHWDRLISAARAKGLSIDHELLTRLYAQQKASA